jgi:hypothetical protein
LVALLGVLVLAQGPPSNVGVYAPPSVRITSPTTSSTYDNGSATTIDLSGTATTTFTVSSCAYSVAGGASGSASVVGTTWSASAVALSVGSNTITVTCTASSGGSSNDSIVVSVGSGSVSVNLTAQEALYSGGSSGVSRTDEPVTVGIPLPDSATTGVTGTSRLSITGATAGQFRVLGTWPSGRAKWVLVDTLVPSLSAGGTSTALTLATGGSGNFGGSNLAVDNGATITVTTGTATFTIKKANFNGFDQVVVGSTTVVATGTSKGLVIMGPACPDTSCDPGTCSTEYSSLNDTSSTATIEENGPVRSVVKATGSYKDAEGHAYIKYTVRFHFYKGKAWTRAVTSLRNADFSASTNFASAYKAMVAEWRLTANISGTLSYQFGKDAGSVESGTLTSTNPIDSAYMYAAKTSWLQHDDALSGGYVAETADEGWKTVANGVTLDSGPISEHVEGWADIRNAAGAGVSIGIEQMHANWPKSLEFHNGGSDVRVGLFPAMNSRTFHLEWPQYRTFDVYFNFHDAALSSPVSEFLKFQHPVFARAPLAQYNTSDAWPFYKIPTAAAEDAYYASVVSSANPASSFSPTPITDVTSTTLDTYRNWDWPDGGDGNQQDYRLGWMQQWFARGLDARMLHTRYWMRYQMDSTHPRSDEFNWRSESTGKDTSGRPSATSTNSSSGYRAWVDSGDHRHIYGIYPYYFLTGDEGIKDSILDGYADWTLDDGTPQTGGSVANPGNDGVGTPRTAALALIQHARLITWLRDVGMTSEVTTAITNADALFEADFKPDFCTRQDELALGCDSDTDSSGQLVSGYETATLPEGISRTRGLFWNAGGHSTWCGTSPGSSWRTVSVWSGMAWAAQGLYEISEAAGSTSAWSDYWIARDLAYGVVQGMEGEMWRDLGDGQWNTRTGWHGYWAVDRAANCASPPPTYDETYFDEPHGVLGKLPYITLWIAHTVKYELTGSQDWTAKLGINMNKSLNYVGSNSPEWFSWMLASAVYAAGTSSATLQTLSHSITHLGGGTYRVSWTTPSNATSYRVKYSTTTARTLVDYIGFDELTGTFTGTPTTQMNWFAATNYDSAPAVGSAFTTQTVDISTGNTGLSTAHFMVKAYCTGTCETTSSAPTGITWTALTLAGASFNGSTAQLALRWLPSLSKIWFYSADEASIYSKDLFYVTPTTSTATFTKLGGTPGGQFCDTYPATMSGGWSSGDNASQTPWPADRHPDSMVAVDTSRNQVYQWSGLACLNAPAGEGLVYKDLWRWDLATSVWVKLAPSTLPTVAFGASLIYVPTYDLLVLTGGDTPKTYVYCLGSSLTADQISAGCGGLNNFYLAYEDLLPDDPNTLGYTPDGSYFNQSFFDPITGYIFGFRVVASQWQGGGTWPVSVARYNVLTKSWTQLTPTGGPTNLNNDQVETSISYISSGSAAGLFHYHRTCHSGTGGCGQAADFIYTPSSSGNGSWTQITSNGGPDTMIFQTFVPTLGTKGAAVGYGHNLGWWIGVFQ